MNQFPLGTLQVGNVIDLRSALYLDEQGRSQGGAHLGHSPAPPLKDRIL